jgi:hypothetical protein
MSLFIALLLLHHFGLGPGWYAFAVCLWLLRTATALLIGAFQTRQ